MKEIKRVSLAEATSLSGHLKDAWMHVMSPLHSPKPTDHELFKMSVYILKQEAVSVVDISNQH